MALVQLNYLKYLYYRLVSPANIDFIDMGLGIEARYQRCRAYWDRHLNLCKEFQANALENTNSKSASIAVLGAGRLLDLHINLICAKSSVISLYDADPTCLSAWEKQFKDFQGKTNFKIYDLTGSIHAWTSKLNKFLTSNRQDTQALANFIKNLELRASPDLGGVDIVISLNFLSQIPIYWRDRLHKLVKKHWGFETDPNGCYCDNVLQEALEKTLGLLQEQHLMLLANSNANKIILISDSEWFYYTQDQSEWQSERALWFESDLTQTLAKQMPNYKITNQDSWLWHIAPQGIEQGDHGIIHKIQAIELMRR